MNKALKRKLALALLGVSLLAGCAAERSYREGMQLVKNGQAQPGLDKLKQASQLEPSRADYRQAYLSQRERHASEQVALAEQATTARRRVEAAALYRAALAIDPGHLRALQGLADLSAGEQTELRLAQAQTALDKGELDSAATLTRSILSDDARDRRARELLRQIERRRPSVDRDPLLADAYKTPIHIEFRDVPLRTVFDVVSRTSGLNIIFDRDLQADQRTTISLKDSTIEAVLNVLSITHQIDYRTLDSNTILVYANTAQKAKDYQALVVKTFLLSSADAKQVATTLRTIAKSKEVVVDEKLNMLIVRDSPHGIRLAERLVMLHDVREAEVMLEVEVLEVSRQRLLDLGVQWPSRLSLSLQPTAAPLNMLELTQGLPRARRDELLTGLKLIPDASVDFAANFRNNTGDTNLIANPRIRVKSRDKAKIVVGDRVPVITVTGNATNSSFLSESVSYIDVGLKLEVEPTVYLDDEVSIKLAMEVSSIANQVTTRSGSVAYQIGTRNASTVLQLVDGETQVLAGLISDEDRKSAAQLPGLGDIPLLGRLFGNRTTTAAKTEIVLAITPRIVRNIPQIESSLAEFDSGTESNLRARPLILGKLALAPKASVDGARRSAAAGGDATSGAAPAPTSEAGDRPTATAFAWQGAPSTRVGEVISVELHFEGQAKLVTLPLSLAFDPKIFELVGIQTGSTFSRENGGVVSSRVTSPGQVRITAIRPTGGAEAGTALVVQLKALEASAGSELALTSVDPISVGGMKARATAPLPHRIRVQP
jgi:general secretion pathway protein D